MRDDGVPCLHEGFHGHLPVRRNHFAHPDCRRAFFVTPTLEVFGQGCEIFLKTGSLPIFPDEYVPTPAAYLRLGQRHFFVAQMAEVPAAGNLLQTAVLVPRKPMERTLKLIGGTVFGTQFTAAVQADIVKGPHGTIVLAADDVGTTGVFVDDVISRARHILFAGGKLPDIRPELFVLELFEFGAGVAAGRERLRAAVGVAFLRKKIRDWARIRLHQVRPADSWGSIAAGGLVGFFVNVLHTSLNSRGNGPMNPHQYGAG